jgi:hypothetical protein
VDEAAKPSALQPEPSHHAQHGLVRPSRAPRSTEKKYSAAPNVIGVCGRQLLSFIASEGGLPTISAVTGATFISPSRADVGGQPR